MGHGSGAVGGEVFIEEGRRRGEGLRRQWGLGWRKRESKGGQCRMGAEGRRGREEVGDRGEGRRGMGSEGRGQRKSGSDWEGETVRGV
jgi:hypothetical protein